MLYCNTFTVTHQQIWVKVHVLYRLILPEHSGKIDHVLSRSVIGVQEVWAISVWVSSKPKLFYNVMPKIFKNMSQTLSNMHEQFTYQKANNSPIIILPWHDALLQTVTGFNKKRKNLPTNVSTTTDFGLVGFPTYWGSPSQGINMKRGSWLKRDICSFCGRVAFISVIVFGDNFLGGAKSRKNTANRGTDIASSQFAGHEWSTWAPECGHGHVMWLDSLSHVYNITVYSLNIASWNHFCALKLCFIQKADVQELSLQKYAKFSSRFSLIQVFSILESIYKDSGQ